MYVVYAEGNSENMCKNENKDKKQDQKQERTKTKNESKKNEEKRVSFQTHCLHLGVFTIVRLLSHSFSFDGACTVPHPSILP